MLIRLTTNSCRGTFGHPMMIPKQNDPGGTGPLMGQPADTFYDDMAAAYHLIFDDWDAAIERQQAVLSRLLPPPADAGLVLDCACGIGTQALGLARAGYNVEGTDLSRAEIERAKGEAFSRGLDIAFRVDDMR
jgi:glycine/sarcosine N-methyltransferase